MYQNKHDISTLLSYLFCKLWSPCFLHSCSRDDQNIQHGAEQLKWIIFRRASDAQLVSITTGIKLWRWRSISIQRHSSLVHLHDFRVWTFVTQAVDGNLSSVTKLHHDCTQFHAKDIVPQCIEFPLSNGDHYLTANVCNYSWPVSTVDK